MVLLGAVRATMPSVARNAAELTTMRTYGGDSSRRAGPAGTSGRCARSLYIYRIALIAVGACVSGRAVTSELLNSSALAW